MRLDAGGEVDELAISYAVDAARWWPVYSVRLEGSDDVATLSLEAFVAQASMEDWSDVQCALSTADLTRDVALPELALDELAAARERKGFLDAQSADLTDAITTLEDAIRKIDQETRALLIPIPKRRR